MLFLLRQILRDRMFKPRYSYSSLIPILLCCTLFGCASSEVSRDAASNVDMGNQNAKNLVSGVGDTSVSDMYNNSSQTTKGAVIGGTTGAVAGAFSSGIGVIPGAATGLILGASYGSYIDSQANVQDKLENRGATVVVLGDQILIVLPSSRLFQAMTAELKPDAYTTLGMVARYVNNYDKMLVKVSAYTNDTGSPRVDLALSQQQAANVERVLLLKGMDARVVYAAGYGGTHLVERNSSDWDGSDNYRIEITLEKLPA